MTDRYSLVSEIGRGGMGVVWKACDDETGATVAVKLLRDAYAEDPDYVRRFEREAELAQRIDSIHVVKVLDYGFRDKVPFLALEYIDGPSLYEALTRHGPYGWPETRAILAQLAQGLEDHLFSRFQNGVNIAHGRPRRVAFRAIFRPPRRH